MGCVAVRVVWHPVVVRSDVFVCWPNHRVHDASEWSGTQPEESRIIFLKLYRFLNAVACRGMLHAGQDMVYYISDHMPLNLMDSPLFGRGVRMWPARMFNDIIVTFQGR